MSQSRYESLTKKSNDTPNGVIDVDAHDSNNSTLARKRLVDYFDWLIEAHAALRKQYKESEEWPDDEDTCQLLQLHPLGAKNSPARGRSNKANSEDQ